MHVCICACMHAVGIPNVAGLYLVTNRITRHAIEISRQQSSSG